MLALLDLITTYAPAAASLGGALAGGVGEETNVNDPLADDVSLFGAALAAFLETEPDESGPAVELQGPDPYRLERDLIRPGSLIEEWALTTETAAPGETSEKHRVVAGTYESLPAIRYFADLEAQIYPLTEGVRPYSPRADSLHMTAALTRIRIQADAAAITTFASDQRPVKLPLLGDKTEHLDNTRPLGADAAIPGADRNSNLWRVAPDSPIEVSAAALTGIDRPKAEQSAIPRAPEALPIFTSNFSSLPGPAFDAAEFQTPTLNRENLRQPPNSLAPSFAATVIRSPDGAIQVQMEPDNIGRMHIEFDGQGETARATISVERIESLDIARRHGEVLTRELERQGFSSVDLMFRSGGRDEFTKWSSDLERASESEPAMEIATIGSSHVDGQSFDLRV